MKKLLCAVGILFSCVLAHGQQIIDLSGAWQFSTSDSVKFGDVVLLPGSMLTNGKGDDVSVNTQWTGSLYDSSFYFNPFMEKYRVEGQMKFPFFLTPEKHYVGAAWYKRKIYVPKDFKNHRITLFLERPHIETTVYVNGKRVGHQLSLSTPHRYDVSSCIKAGKQNEILIKVYNGIENVCVGQDSHSVTDQTQGNWNGIAGRIELQAQWKKLNIRGIKVEMDSFDLQLPDIERKGQLIRGKKEKTYFGKITVKLENNVAGVRVMPLWDYNVDMQLMHASGPKKGKVIHRTYSEATGDELSMYFPFAKDVEPWDEFRPNLYRLHIEAGEDVFETLVGFRKVGTQGRQLMINGHPMFLRGTVENCCFPETGYPPTNEDEWKYIFKKCKEFGLNHVRFHSYCPPEAAFAAADQVGIYLQPEGPSWPNHGVRLRRGQKIDEYLLAESKRIVDEYGHHPSFLMMAAGNEPAGDWVNYCNDWVKEMKKYDPTKIYCGASVGGGWAWDDGAEYHVKGGARGLDWDRHAPSSDDDYYSGIEFPRNYKGTTPNQTPIVAHEQGQWCAFPDLKEVSQYTGAYKAHNFEIFQDLLKAGGMESQAEEFLEASGKLQVLCYKYEIERNLRTKDYAGFQLLGLNDYSGQGTALVGPLNVFWRDKSYVDASYWHEFCNPLVLLARFPRFVYTDNERLQVPIELMNATPYRITAPMLHYDVMQGDSVMLSGSLPTPPIAIGKNNEIGVIDCSLSSIKVPAKLTLVASLGAFVINRWDFWVYPSSVLSEETDAVFIAEELNEQAMQVLQQGGNVLLTAAGKVTLGSDVKQTYLPVFWNTSWFKMRPPHTTGAYIDTSHPLFKYGFPTDNWSNLNWWELLNKAQVMNLRELPANYQPPIQPIDTWHVSRKLGMLIEARVGKGRLVMTTMDISSKLDERVVARQMRNAILRYMKSADFQPTLELTPEVIRDFYTKQAPPVNMFTNDSPDELKPKLTQ